jgi:hypothetical protein
MLMLSNKLLKEYMDKLARKNKMRTMGKNREGALRILRGRLGRGNWGKLWLIVLGMGSGLIVINTICFISEYK